MNTRLDDADTRYGIWLTRAVWAAFGVMLVQGLYGIPAYFGNRVLGEGPPTIAAAVAAAVIAIVVALRYAPAIGGAAQRIGDRLSAVSPRIWLAGVLAVGCLLRVFWLVLYPPDVQVSDHATYQGLARSLAGGEPYYTNGTYSYWPPGLPLFLAAGYALLGIHAWVAGLLNLLLYVATTFVTWHLGKLVSGQAAARIGTALLAIWPNLVMSSSLVKKELLVALLVPLALLLYLQAASATGRRIALLAVTGGMALGAACLTQPSFMLLPAVVALYELFVPRPVFSRLARLALFAAGMVLVIAPWTVRNYRVLHAFVPIATNGGEVFYSGNNALASDGWVPRYERDLPQDDELAQNRIGYEWGKEWIRENPRRFLELFVAKQLAVMSDDSESAYWTLKAGRHIEDLRYFALKGISNLFWLTAVWLMFLVLIRRWQMRDARWPPVILTMLAVLYIWTIAGFFQGGSRHHMPFIPVFAVMIGMLAEARPAERGSRPGSKSRRE